MQVQMSNPGVVMMGAVPFTPLATLQAQEEAKRKALETANQSTPVVTGLSGYIETCWSKAKQAKITVEEQMMRNLRQRNGQYEADKLAAVQEMGGSDVYVLLTEATCRSAESWLNDLIRPIGERPWALKPTPIPPTLPPDIEQQIVQEVQKVGQELLAAIQVMGLELPEDVLARELRDYAANRRDEILKAAQDEAESRSERMSQLIDDQLAEGGWHEAFWSVVSDLVTLKAGIIKGPVLRKRKVPKWSTVNGKWVLDTTEQIVPEFVRVSPFDLYPAPDSRHPNDGYLIERHKLSRTEVQAMIGVPGYSDTNIRAALAQYGSGLKSMLAIDSELAPIEFSGNYSSLTAGEKIEALEFWGPVQGKLLIEWGLAAGIDPDLDYEVNSWKIGNYVIRAILNPDKLGRKPYSINSYERVPGSFWGKGVPELMSDNQDVCNAVARAIVNNAQLASGPQVEVDTDRCAANNVSIHPWKIWEVTTSQMRETPAVRFTQPQCVVQPLLQVFEMFSSLAENSTGIPRWAYGNANVGGAGDTSSGLSMLMTQASRGIKDVVAHIDTMTQGCISRLYDYNMMYADDDSVKGDLNVIARGSSALLAKEQRIARTNEFLRSTNNPVDIQIVGLEGRAKLLKEAAKGLEIDAEDIIPDKEGIKQIIAKIEEQQAALIAAGQNPGQPGQAPPGPKPTTLDAAGAPAGGTDTNVFQNQRGASTNGMIANG